jgi:hypothetical protein
VNAVVVLHGGGLAAGPGVRRDLGSSVPRVGEHDDVTTLAVRYTRHPFAVWRSIPDALVVTVGSPAPLRIAGSAALVWQHLEQPATVEDIVRRLETEVEVPAARLQEDVSHLLDELVARGVVTAR